MAPSTNLTKQGAAREYNNYTLKWLSMHEALPGHYVQAEPPMTSNLQRGIWCATCSPMDRTWKVGPIHCGRHDAGGLSGLEPEIPHCQNENLAACSVNTILDIRMQTMNMTDQQAMDLMMNDTFQTQAEADSKLRRTS